MANKREYVKSKTWSIINRCYTVYEKQCKYVNEPQCMTNLRENCENHPVKSCRDVDKFEDVVSGGYNKYLSFDFKSWSL